MNRPSVLDDEDDLSRFTPTKERVREVATAGGFPSRQPAPARTAREPYRYRTGRTEQFSVRIKPEDHDEFYAIARQNNWKIGETVEAALHALKEKLGR